MINYDENLTITRPLAIAYAEAESNTNHRPSRDDAAFWAYVRDQKRKDDAAYFAKHGTHVRQW